MKINFDINILTLLTAVSIIMLSVLKLLGVIHYSPVVGSVLMIVAIINLIISIIVTRR